MLTLVSMALNWWPKDSFLMCDFHQLLMCGTVCTRLFYIFGMTAISFISQDSTQSKPLKPFLRILRKRPVCKVQFSNGCKEGKFLENGPVRKITNNQESKTQTVHIIDCLYKNLHIPIKSTCSNTPPGQTKLGGNQASSIHVIMLHVLSSDIFKDLHDSICIGECYFASKFSTRTVD